MQKIKPAKDLIDFDNQQLLTGDVFWITRTSYRVITCELSIKLMKKMYFAALNYDLCKDGDPTKGSSAPSNNRSIFINSLYRFDMNRVMRKILSGLFDALDPISAFATTNSANNLFSTNTNGSLRPCWVSIFNSGDHYHLSPHVNNYERESVNKYSNISILNCYYV